MDMGAGGVRTNSKPHTRAPGSSDNACVDGRLAQRGRARGASRPAGKAVQSPPPSSRIGRRSVRSLRQRCGSEQVPLPNRSSLRAPRVGAAAIESPGSCRRISPVMARTWRHRTIPSRPTRVVSGRPETPHSMPMRPASSRQSRANGLSWRRRDPSASCGVASSRRRTPARPRRRAAWAAGARPGEVRTGRPRDPPTRAGPAPVGRPTRTPEFPRPPA